jgi:hypothetical protein
MITTRLWGLTRALYSNSTGQEIFLPGEHDDHCHAQKIIFWVRTSYWISFIWATPAMEKWKFQWFFDVRGSVHHSTIHKEKSNKMQQCIRILLFLIIWSSICFGRHTAHHQELKTALAASGFSYVEGCWTCSEVDVVRHMLCLKTSGFSWPF